MPHPRPDARSRARLGLRTLGLAVLVTASAIAAAPSRAEAQRGGLSVWLGAGQSVTRDSIPLTLKNADLYGALQLDIPLFPLAIRADASVGNSDFRDGQRSASASLVLPLRAPFVEPYAMLGYGVYDWGKSYEARGVSYGGGVRLHLSRLGIFAQVRRHEVLDRAIGTVGLTF